MKTRHIVIALLTLAFGLLAGSYVVGGMLSAPSPKSISKPVVDFTIETVEFPSASESVLSGWFILGQPNKGGVILLHGVRASRLDMLNRARFLNDSGYSVLLFDFQAHGESPGKHISYGYLESLDAEAAFNFLKSKIPNQNIAVIGSSLGGASILLSNVADEIDALVLEATYTTFDKAIANRLAIRLGESGRILSPLFTYQSYLRFGINPKILSPLSRISQLTAPILIIAGENDRHTTLTDSELLYEAANQPKELWVINDAGHQDFHRFAKDEYEQRIGLFLRQYL